MADNMKASADKPVELNDDQIEHVAGGGDPAETEKKRKAGGAQQEFLTVRLNNV